MSYSLVCLLCVCVCFHCTHNTPGAGRAPPEKYVIDYVFLDAEKPPDLVIRRLLERGHIMHEKKCTLLTQGVPGGATLPSQHCPSPTHVNANFTVLDLRSTTIGMMKPLSCSETDQGLFNEGEPIAQRNSKHQACQSLQDSRPTLATLVYNPSRSATVSAHRQAPGPIAGGFILKRDRGHNRNRT